MILRYLWDFIVHPYQCSLRKLIFYCFEKWTYEHIHKEHLIKRPSYRTTQMSMGWKWKWMVMEIKVWAWAWAWFSNVCRTPNRFTRSKKNSHLAISEYAIDIKSTKHLDDELLNLFLLLQKKKTWPERLECCLPLIFDSLLHHIILWLPIDASYGFA